MLFVELVVACLWFYLSGCVCGYVFVIVCLWSRSGREHWAWMVVVEVRQGTLGVNWSCLWLCVCGRGAAGNTGRGWSWLRSGKEH